MTDQTTYPKQILARPNQNQQIANRIFAARKIILAARADPEICGLLAAHGYGAGELSVGMDLHKAARAAFTASQWALGGQRRAVTAFEAARMAACQVFADFLAVSRYLFKDGKARSVLGLDESIPEEPAKFIPAARVRYQAAKSNVSYCITLNQYGSLENAIASLDELVAAEKVMEAACTAAGRAIQQRDEVFTRLDRWTRDFCSTLKAALRDRPDLLHKIGL